MTTEELTVFKQKALQWAEQYEVCCCFDSNGYADPYSKYDFLLAAGEQSAVKAATGSAFEALRVFQERKAEWMFGLFSYDLKNELEALPSAKADLLQFPDLYFFVPEYLIAVKNGTVEIIYGPPGLIEDIHNWKLQSDTTSNSVLIQAKLDKAAYVAKVEELRRHILEGDIYEINFCQEFFAENARIDPYQVYQKLNRLSPTPFSGYFKIRDKYILSASPERFLCKRGNKLYSQPIKGTARRSTLPQEDLEIRLALQNSAKEQAENVMIVDLVRNDLTRCAVPGTVKVEELFGIYSFPQVHQMISTVSCELNPDINLADAIRYCFPMGSMTGAPKVRAMQLIDEIELSKRGIYSGAFGYFSPDGDFDFNVVIRSILYNENSGYLSFQVGGAITYASSAEAEYEECLLKASAIVRTLKN
jgi:para-aminobenzoate synthetase component 1